MKAFPISLGNVVYLDGELPQDTMRALCTSYITDDESAAALQDFVKTLARHGRPSAAKHVETLFGVGLADIIADEGRGSLRYAPWRKDVDGPAIWECHVDDSLYVGWWLEARKNVLMRMPFDGDWREGLTPLEIARVIAAHATPPEALIDWITNWVQSTCAMSDAMRHDVNLLTLMPSTIRRQCDPQLQQERRKVFVSALDCEDGSMPTCNLFERPSDAFL